MWGNTLLRWPMYLLHFCTSTVAQNCWISWTSSSLFAGLMTRWMYSCRIKTPRRELVGNTLTLGTSSSVCSGHAKSCWVIAASGFAAVSRNIFELQSPCRQLALLCLQLSEEGQQCAGSAFLTLVVSQFCRSRHSICGNVTQSVL